MLSSLSHPSERPATPVSQHGEPSQAKQPCRDLLLHFYKMFGVSEVAASSQPFPAVKVRIINNNVLAYVTSLDLYRVLFLLKSGANEINTHNPSKEVCLMNCQEELCFHSI